MTGRGCWRRAAEAGRRKRHEEERAEARRKALAAEDENMQRAREAQAGRASSLSRQRGASKGGGKGTVRRLRRVRYDRWLQYGMNIEQDGLVRTNVLQVFGLSS